MARLQLAIVVLLGACAAEENALLPLPLEDSASPAPEGDASSDSSEPAPEDDASSDSSEPAPEDDASSVPIEPRCGDGIVDPGELCGWTAGTLHEGWGSDVLLADFFGDGRNEIVVPSSSESETRVLDTDSGSFVLLATLEGASNAAAGDLDGDGRDELVTVSEETFSVTEADEAGTFSTTSHYLPGLADTTRVAIGDIDGDAAPDLLFATGTSLVYAQNSGQASFTAVADHPLPFDDPATEVVSIFVRDINGDANPDVLVSVRTYWDATSTAYLLRGQAGTLLAPEPILEGASEYAVVAIGPGATRIVGVEDSAGVTAIRCYASNGTGGFAVQRTSVVTSYAKVVFHLRARVSSTFDINGDGVEDLLLAAEGVAGFFIGDAGCGFASDGALYRADWPARVGDVNGDDLIDLVDPRAVYLADPVTGIGAPRVYPAKTSLLWNPELGGYDYLYRMQSQMIDLDADGRLDIAVYGEQGGKLVAVLMRNTGGRLIERRRVVMGTLDETTHTHTTSWFSVGNFDGAGPLDLMWIKSEHDEPWEATVYCATGAFEYAVCHHAPLDADIWPLDLPASDMNGDELDDVLMGWRDGQETGLAVLESVAGGGLVRGDEPSIAGAVQARLVQMDGVGALDIVEVEGAEIRVYLVLPGGSIALPVVTSLPFEVPPWEWLTFFEDMDGDGTPDLLVSGDPFQVIFGRPDGTFQSPESHELPGEWLRGTADLNNDGTADVLGTWTIRLGDGMGGFEAPLDTYAPGQPVDFDGDGAVDLVDQYDYWLLQSVALAKP